MQQHVIERTLDRIGIKVELNPAHTLISAVSHSK